jgi:hypothetical protein
MFYFHFFTFVYHKLFSVRGAKGVAFNHQQSAGQHLQRHPRGKIGNKTIFLTALQIDAFENENDFFKQQGEYIWWSMPFCFIFIPYNVVRVHYTRDKLVHCFCLRVACCGGLMWSGRSLLV